MPTLKELQQMAKTAKKLVDTTRKASTQVSGVAQQGREVAERIGNSVKRKQRIEFAEAAMATCALIAAADGTISAPERRCAASFAGTSPELKAFSVDELQQMFVRHAGLIEIDRKLGRIHLLQIIGRAQPEDAQTLMRLGRLIAESDGPISPEQLTELEELRSTLG